MIANDFYKVIKQTPLKGEFWNEKNNDLNKYFHPIAAQTQEIGIGLIRNSIRYGAPAVIPSRLPDHITNASINGDWIALGNRGDRIDHSRAKSHLNQSGSYFYHIPNLEDKLSVEFIEKLRDDEDSSSLQELQNMEHAKVLYIPRKDQKRGNCSYANGKLLVQDHLVFFVAEQKGIKLEEITGENDPKWKEITKEAKLLYRDFTIHQRVQAFNEYAEKHFDPSSPKECELITLMYQEIKTMVSKGPTSESGCFQVLDIRDDNDQEIPILDQLNPRGVTAAKAAINLRTENLFQERRDFYKNWSNEDYFILIDTFGEDRVTSEDPHELFIESAKEGKTKALEAFLRDENIDVNQIDKQKQTPLNAAIMAGQTESVKILLNNAKIDVNLASGNGNPPIIRTILNEDIESLKLLLAHRDIDLNPKKIFGLTLLQFASTLKNKDFEKLLIAHQNSKANDTTEEPPQPTA